MEVFTEQSLRSAEYCRADTGEWLDRNIWRVALRSGRQIIDWQAHTGWAYGLLANMPEPEPVPRPPRARPSKDTAP